MYSPGKKSETNHSIETYKTEIISFNPDPCNCIAEWRSGVASLGRDMGMRLKFGRLSSGDASDEREKWRISSESRITFVQDSLFSSWIFLDANRGQKSEYRSRLWHRFLPFLLNTKMEKE